MTDLYVYRSEEVRDRDDDDARVCFLHRPERSGELWSAFVKGTMIEAPTRGILLTRIERRMLGILVFTPKIVEPSRYERQRAAQENAARHKRERGVKKVKGAK